MKGLIVKDIMSLKAQGKVLPLILAFFLLLGIITGGSEAIFSYLSTFLLVFLFTWITTAFSTDNTVQWDVYALSTPVRRRSIVLARYLLIYGMMAFAFLLLLGLLLLQMWLSSQTDFELGLVMGGILLLAYSIIPSVLLPLLYRFGPEKSRFLFLLVAAIPFIFSFLMGKLNLALPTELPALQAGQGWIPVALAAAVILVSAAISFLLSVHIYEKKEF